MSRGRTKNKPIDRRGECIACGVEFSYERPYGGGSPRKYCSDACYRTRQAYLTKASRQLREGSSWALTFEQFVALRRTAFCSYCGVSVSGRECQLDQVAAGQGYYDGNVVVACSKCNARKNDGPACAATSAAFYEAFLAAEGSPGGEA